MFSECQMFSNMKYSELVLEFVKDIIFFSEPEFVVRHFVMRAFKL